LEDWNLSTWLFASDLHGRPDLYEKLFAVVRNDRPGWLLLGGDLLPGTSFADAGEETSFISTYLVPSLLQLRESLGAGYPSIMIILGNDDPACEEKTVLAAEADSLWRYVHGRQVRAGKYTVCGCSFVPPTPFLLKDWERYDVSRYVDPGSLAPDEGCRTVPESDSEIRFGTIRCHLERLAEGAAMERTICLFHAPPYNTVLDRAALDGVTHEGVALDPHVGSIAILRFIRDRQPLLTLHGHIHESARLTGAWKTIIGRTVCINAAHDGPELSLVRFDADHPEAATRELL
jgi:Icc-related predicted phosphoesterase